MCPALGGDENFGVSARRVMYSNTCSPMLNSFGWTAVWRKSGVRIDEREATCRCLALPLPTTQISARLNETH